MNISFVPYMDYVFLEFFTISLFTIIGHNFIEKISELFFSILSKVFKINIDFFQPVLKPFKVFIIGLIIFTSYFFTIKDHLKYLESSIFSIFNLFIVLTSSSAGYNLASFMIPYLLKKKHHACSKRTRLNEEIIVFLLKIGKICITFVGIIAILNILGINVMGLAAGLGLAGLTLGLAAQDSLKNFFATITILLDNVFAEGDHIKIDSISGVIEYVGFRSTKILTSNYRVIFIPNYKLSDSIVINYSKTPFRELELVINITTKENEIVIADLIQSITTSLSSASNLLKKEYISIYVDKVAYHFIGLKLSYKYPLEDDAGVLQEELMQKISNFLSTQYPGSSANCIGS